jgi:hypothetical protein
MPRIGATVCSAWAQSLTVRIKYTKKRVTRGWRTRIASRASAVRERAQPQNDDDRDATAIVDAPDCPTVPVTQDNKMAGFTAERVARPREFTSTADSVAQPACEGGH